MGRFQIIVDPDLEEIMDRYMEIRLQEQADMEQALADGDGEAVRLFGHRLKGTGASYGFRRLTELGAAIEIAGRQGDLTSAQALVAQVREFIENVDVVFGE